MGNAVTVGLGLGVLTVSPVIGLGSFLLALLLFALVGRRRFRNGGVWDAYRDKWR